MRTFFREHLTPFRWGIIGVFALAQVVVLAWLWDGMGGSLGRVNTGFEMAATLEDGHSLQHAADVRIEGVTVGQVRDIQLTDDHLSEVHFHIRDESVLPMREGMTILPRVKSLLDDVYLEITPGPAGADPLEEGTVLPAENSIERVQLDEVFEDLDAATMADAEVLLGDLGEGFSGRAGEINDLATALGPLGDHGRQLFSTLVETQADLEGLIDDTAVLFDVLDERDAQLVALVDDAAQLAAATARQDDAIARTVEELPPTIEKLQESSSSIVTLSDALEPVARDLSAAAPDLNQVLEDLGPTATVLEASLPDLDAVLDELPPLLDTFPDASEQILALLDPAPEVLSHLNPSLRYIAPYAPEVASLFATWSDVMSTGDENGHYVRLVLPLAHPEVINEVPVETVRRNAYPLPGTLGSLDTFGDREFPVVQPDPIPNRPTPQGSGEVSEPEGNVIDDFLRSMQEAAEPFMEARFEAGDGGSDPEDGPRRRPLPDPSEGEDDDLAAAVARSGSAPPPARAPWLSLAAALLGLAVWYVAAEAYRLHRRQRRLVSWEARGWRRNGT